MGARAARSSRKEQGGLGDPVGAAGGGASRGPRGLGEESR